MSHFAAANSTFNAIPPVFWLWAVLTLFATAAIGFGSGVYYARVSVKWAVRKAHKQISSLFVMVLEMIETAQDACSQLERFPNLLLTPEQSERLNSKQSRLLETVTRIVEGQRAAPVELSEDVPGVKPDREDFEVEWQRTPEDHRIGIPDRVAFSDNLEMLLDAGSAAEVESALLLIKVDKLNQLKVRFGASAAETFMKKMSAVICRAMRDQDLACRFATDTFAVLMPNVSKETGARLAQAIRNTVRSHHFRLDASGPEVLLTASFGFTVCRPEDNSDLALNRAGNALSKSQRRGRNQLHVHDGERLVHCATA